MKKEIEKQVQEVLPLLVAQLEEGKDIQISFQKSKNILHLKTVEVKRIK